jgi:hypothetical protein
MRSKFLEAYNAINLIRNGGLDFVGSGMPPFWQLDGASFGGKTANICSVVKNETPVIEDAAVNYFKLFITSALPVTLRQIVAKRFIQPAFCKTMDTSNDGRLPDNHDMDNNRMPRGYDRMEACQLFRGEMSFSFSVRVVSGAAKVSLRFRRPTADGDTRIVYPAAVSKTWSRPVVNEDIYRDIIESLDFVVEKVGGEVAEVHLGAFMAAAGSYDTLPYTGDPMADAIPRGAIVFAVGTACPPGFEKVTLSGVPSKGRAYLKTTSPADLAVEGEEAHSHANMVERMEPEVNWPGLGVEDGWGVAMDESGRGQQYPADLAWDPHTHPITPAVALPSSRDVILCKRL